jgi:hypothetical protein
MQGAAPNQEPVMQRDVHTRRPAGGPGRQKGPARLLLAMGLLAVCLAYVESALVVYLREISAPLRAEHFPQAVREVVPVLTLKQVQEAHGSYLEVLRVEVMRELTPIAALLAAAWGFGRTGRQVAGFFLMGFGLWDLFYYVFLWALLGWPASPMTWDLLFLIPTVWVAPVLAPVLVSASMTGAGIVYVLRAPVRVGRRRAAAAAGAIAAGVALVLASFVLRQAEAYRRVPEAFDWWVFLPGWLLGTAGLLALVGRSAGAGRRAAQSRPLT